jgi:selenocysteine lyase/cysteine desulfurase
LRSKLAAIPGVTVTDRGERRCGLCSFVVSGRSAEEIKTALAAQRIHASVSGIRSTRIDMEARGLSEVVRASVHYYNTEQEVDRLCAAVEQLVPKGGS